MLLDIAILKQRFFTENNINNQLQEAPQLKYGVSVMATMLSIVHLATYFILSSPYCAWLCARGRCLDLTILFFRHPTEFS